jgi:hypothetical protein
LGVGSGVFLARSHTATWEALERLGFSDRWGWGMSPEWFGPARAGRACAPRESGLQGLGLSIRCTTSREPSTPGQRATSKRDRVQTIFLAVESNHGVFPISLLFLHPTIEKKFISASISQLRIETRSLLNAFKLKAKTVPKCENRPPDIKNHCRHFFLTYNSFLRIFYLPRPNSRPSREKSMKITMSGHPDLIP